METTYASSRTRDRVFAEGLSFYKKWWIFIAGSVIGTWYEEVITFVTKGVWENRSAVIVGPFNPLYGVGFLLAVVLLHRIKSWWVSILIGAVVFGGFEYAASWAQQFFTGSVSWDYRNLWFNIHGRTTVHYALFWGLFATFMVKIVFQPLSSVIEKIPYHTGRFITQTLIIFLAANMLITYTMLIRQGLRAQGHEPLTPIGVLYDQHFTDEWIQDHFPNMNLIVGEEGE